VREELVDLAERAVFDVAYCFRGSRAGRFLYLLLSGPPPFYDITTGTPVPGPPRLRFAWYTSRSLAWRTYMRVLHRHALTHGDRVGELRSALVEIFGGAA